MNQAYNKNKVFLVHNNCKVEEYLRKSYRQLYLILYSIQNTNQLKGRVTRLQNESIDEKTIFSKDVSKIIKKYEPFLNSFRNLVDEEDSRKETTSTCKRQDEDKGKIQEEKKSGNSQIRKIKYEKFLEDSLKQLQEIFQFYQNRQSQLTRKIFEEHARILALEMKINVFLPTILKVTLLNINSLDFKKRVADIKIKIKLKVHIPGFTSFPNMYEKMLRKLKIRIKTEKNQWQIQDSYIDFSKITKENKVYKNLKEYCSEDHRFNDMQRKIWFKKFGEEYEGLILTTQIPHVTVEMIGDTFTSPFQVFDLKGIIQLLPIQTSLEEWKKSIFIQEEKLKNFVFKQSPNIILRFNLISLYKNQIEFSDMVQVNHINSKEYFLMQNYQLALKKMLLEITDSHKSSYTLRRDPKKMFCYDWAKTSCEEEYQLTEVKRYLNGQVRYIQQMEKHRLIFERLKKLDEIGEGEKRSERQSSQSERIRKQIKAIQSELALINDYYRTKEEWQYEKSRPKSKDILQNIQRYYYLKVAQEQQQQVLKVFSNNLFIKQNLNNEEIKEKIKKMRIKKRQALDQIARLDQNRQLIPQTQSQLIIDKVSDSQAHFHFPIFNNPGQLVLSTFFLIVLQGFSVLLLFYHPNSIVGGLVAAISSIGSLVRIVKQLSIEVVKRKFSILELIANLILMVPILFTIDIISYENVQSEKRSYESLFYWASAFITIINLLVPFLIYLNHRYFERRAYTNSDFVNITNKKILKQNMMPGSLQVDKYLGISHSPNQQIEGEMNTQTLVLQSVINYLTILHYLRLKMNYYPDLLYRKLHINVKEKINYLDTILQYPNKELQ